MVLYSLIQDNELQADYTNTIMVTYVIKIKDINTKATLVATG